MNEADNSALVPRPPGALEKAEPGAKRILGGMVADTLALAKKLPSRSQRPLRIVSVDDEELMRLVWVEMAIYSHLKGVCLHSFLDAREAWQELSRTDPDLLITDDIMPDLTGYEIVGRLVDKKVTYPIIVVSGWDGPETEQLVSDCVKRGANVTLLHVPYKLEDLATAVRSALKISRGTTGPVEIAVHPTLVPSADAEEAEVRSTRSLRIVMVNDEPLALQSFHMWLRGWFKGVTLLLCADGVEAWEELSRTDPDLVITDDAMPRMRGSELCQRLLDRKVAYPIIVNSAWAPTEQWVREFASRGLNVSFLALPCDFESLRKALEAAGLKTPRDTLGKAGEIATKPPKSRPLRIVILDNEDWRREILGEAIRVKFNSVVITEFQNGDLAWQELMHSDPDLLITDLCCTDALSGFDMVSRLAEKKAKYPVLVYSGLMDKAGEDHVLRLAGSNLNVTCLYWPFTLQQFYGALSKLLGPDGNLQQQILRGAS